MTKQKCAICGRPAKYRLSPDIDINGLGSCQKHWEDMRTAYVILRMNGIKQYKSFIKGIKI